jgi:thioesterase III
MPAKSHVYELTILERHLDTFGHVNNATYLEILEEARWDWITCGGYGLAEIKASKHGPAILECNVRFKRELLLRESIQVHTDLEEYRGKIAIVRQVIRKPGAAVSCEARFTVGLFDTEARRLVEPTAAWLKAFGLTVQEWASQSAKPSAAGAKGSVSP